MSTFPKGSRITFRQARPNPLFHSWLEELYQEAIEKKSNIEGVLKEALAALSKYPLPFESGAECAILKGFDKKLCAYLDKRLEVYNYNKNVLNNSAPSGSETETYDLPTPEVDCVQYSPTQIPISSNALPQCAVSESQENIDTQNSHSSTNKAAKRKPRGKNAYKPAIRSGGYAILIALLRHYEENLDCPALRKEELMEKAQVHSEESFTRPKPDSYYTAWSNMSRLIAKGLVSKRKNKKLEYLLTEQGILVAKELVKDSTSLPNVNDIIFNDANPIRINADIGEIDIATTREVEECPLPVCEFGEAMIEMRPGTFDVILLIDKCETSGLSKKNDPTVAQFNKYPDLKHEYRNLKVGDFMWVARDKIRTEQELVLPYIVERKRMDDLGASIKDGRFHEQKFRLRKSGLNVIYMVEKYGSNKHVGLPIQSLMQALQNTRVQDNFKVHETASLSNSARFLAMLTKRLTIEFKDKNLKGYHKEPQGHDLMTFSFFNKASSKTKPLTVTEMFIKLLLQLKGASVEKALAITEVYKTPRSLIETYKECTPKDGEFLLANLKYGELSRNVGPALSKSIYHLFSNIDL